LVADLKRKLLKAIGELEEKGFLVPMTKDERFRKDAPGLWKVLFRRAKQASLAEPEAKDEAAPSLKDLVVDFGVREQKALELLENFGEELVRTKLQVASWLKEKGDANLIANPPGYLIASIERGYEAPRLFAEEAQAAERKKTSDLVAKKIAAAEAKKIQRQEEEFARRSKIVENYLLTLTAKEHEALVEKALHEADSAKKRILNLGGKASEALKNTIVENYVLEILAAG
jgi:hypothetical protein